MTMGEEVAWAVACEVERYDVLNVSLGLGE
jgi:hypothetical protein